MDPKSNPNSSFATMRMNKAQKADTGTDFYRIDDLLTTEERALRTHVHRFCDQEVIPIISKYWEQAEFPFVLIPKLASLGIVGGTIEGYGCPGISTTASGLVTAEIARGDGSLNVFLGAHSDLAMRSLAMLGSEEQKERWLPAMARLEKIGAFALTEPEHGSDVISLETRARLQGSEWVINGTKKWIGNASFADIIVLWARDDTGQVSGYLVEKDTPGMTITIITGKTSLRASWQTTIMLNDVHVPIANRLAKAQSFNDTTTVLAAARHSVAWAAVGHALASYEQALAYAKKRVQFGKPLVSFQLIQQKLARMLAEITSMQLLCLRLSQLLADKKMTPGMASLAKMQTASKARQIIADARDILGGNGILLEQHIARHQADMEALYTYEGTDHIQSLIVGREITDVQVFF